MTLRRLVDVLAPDLRAAAERMWCSMTAPEGYRAWLAVAHDLVSATTPLLAQAADDCAARGEGRLAAYFAQQGADEAGHDVWLREDWAAAGGDPARLVERVPTPAAARLAGAQYYYLRHGHPVALLGHIAVLEWNPPRAAGIPRLAARTGLPLDAFRTLSRHAEADLAHGDDSAGCWPASHSPAGADGWSPPVRSPPPAA
jgi:hypothetical protein